MLHLSQSPVPLLYKYPSIQLPPVHYPVVSQVSQPVSQARVQFVGFPTQVAHTVLSQAI